MALSAVPGGEHANYFLQKHVTKSLPISKSAFADKVGYARQHIEMILQYYQRPVTEATFYEFGAGWDLIVPLAFYGCGVEKQILVDVRPLLRPALVNDAIKKFETLPSYSGFVRRPDRYVVGSQAAVAAQLKEFYGIDYKAPCDPRRTGLSCDAVDCITSTSTLEHIPLSELKLVIQECHRLLSPTGVLSLIIDYADHYSYFDSTISPYNYLQYSDRIWSLFSPSLHYQNRLRHRDYLDLLRATGFELLEERRFGTNSQAVQQLALAQRFKTYTLEELAVGSALIVARSHA